MQQRIAWEDLPEETRTAIQVRTGPIEQAYAVSEGTNSALATVLHSRAGRVFVKGIRTDRPSVVTQRREATINLHVRTVAPALRWHLDVAGWKVLGFEYIEGRHPDYRPGSPDLPIVVDLLQALGAIPCPEVPVKDAGQRWAPYLDRPAAVELFADNTLLHTGLQPGEHPHHSGRDSPPDRLGMADPRRRMDRSLLPTPPLDRRRAHRPPGRDLGTAHPRMAQRTRAWHTAPAGALDTFTLASARLWQEIADSDPQPWKQRMAIAAREWADARMPPVGT